MMILTLRPLEEGWGGRALLFSDFAGRFLHYLATSTPSQSLSNAGHWMRQLLKMVSVSRFRSKTVLFRWRLARLHVCDGCSDSTFQ